MQPNMEICIYLPVDFLTKSKRMRKEKNRSWHRPAGLRSRSQVRGSRQSTGQVRSQVRGSETTQVRSGLRSGGPRDLRPDLRPDGEDPCGTLVFWVGCLTTEVKRVRLHLVALRLSFGTLPVYGHEFALNLLRYPTHLLRLSLNLLLLFPLILVQFPIFYFSPWLFWFFVPALRLYAGWYILISFRNPKGAVLSWRYLLGPSTNCLRRAKTT